MDLSGQIQGPLLWCRRAVAHCRQQRSLVAGFTDAVKRQSSKIGVTNREPVPKHSLSGPELAGTKSRQPFCGRQLAALAFFGGRAMNTLQNGGLLREVSAHRQTYKITATTPKISTIVSRAFSSGLAPTEQGYDPQLRYETAFVGGSRTKRSFVRESLRLISCGLALIGISAAAFGWQYGDPETVRTPRPSERPSRTILVEVVRKAAQHRRWH
jgi:hypothetical protein